MSLYSDDFSYGGVYKIEEQAGKTSADNCGNNHPWDENGGWQTEYQHCTKSLSNVVHYGCNNAFSEKTQLRIVTE